MSYIKYDLPSYDSNCSTFVMLGSVLCSISTCRLLLRHCFSQLHSIQVATIHCSAQTSALHIKQKLSQVLLSACFV